MKISAGGLRDEKKFSEWGGDSATSAAACDSISDSQSDNASNHCDLDCQFLPFSKPPLGQELLAHAFSSSKALDISLIRVCSAWSGHIWRLPALGWKRPEYMDAASSE